MSMELNQELGFLAWQPLEGVEMDYAYTELVRRAEEGDVTALAKLKTVAKYVNNKAEVKKYAQEQAPRVEAKLFPEEAKPAQVETAHTTEGHTETHTGSETAHAETHAAEDHTEAAASTTVTPSASPAGSQHASGTTASTPAPASAVSSTPSATTGSEESHTGSQPATSEHH